MNVPQAEPAPLGARLGAWGVDQAIGLLLYVVLLGTVMTAASSGDPSLRALLLVPGAMLVYAVGLLWLLATKGLSPGKKLVGLRVVRVEDGRPLGWGRALGRTLLLGVILGATFGIGAVVLLVLAGKDPQRRAAHDKSAKSIVVRARSVPARPAAAPGPVRQMPTAPPPSPVSGPDPWDDATVMPQPAGLAGSALISAVPGIVQDVPRLGAQVLDDEELIPEPALADTDSDTGDDDGGVELTRMSQRQPGPQGWQLEIGAGQVVPVRGAGLLGRDPEPRRGEAVEHLVAVDDPTRSVSKTHLEFGLDGTSLWVCDRGSTNGSRIVTADGQERDCPSGTRVQVPPGSTLWVGDHGVPVRRT